MYLVECYNDESLLRAMGVPSREIRRIYGKGKLMGFIRRRTDAPCIAVLDMDRNQPQPKELEVFKSERKGHGLQLRTWQAHRVVLLDDNLEDWLVRTVHRAHGRMETFKLPDDPDTLHGIEMKPVDPRIGNLVDFLRERQSEPMRLLREFLMVD